MNRQLNCIFLIALLITGSVLMLFAASPPQVVNDTERLGMHLYKDKNLSLFQNQSCQNCHHPKSGFADRKNFMHPYYSVVSTGSDGVSKGDRNAPSAAYAGYSPIRFYDSESQEWIGGMFWDGRMDGSVLGDPLAEQAQGPPLNIVEMALPDKQAVINVIMESDYYGLWIKVYGGPITNVDEAYNNFGKAIAAYERSADVTKFTSKFDLFLDQFTLAETRGKALFESNCSSCHTTYADYSSPKALFTNYSYANIGVPANPLVALQEPDLGLGGDLGDPSQDGKFKIPTLRNVAMTAPYSHNGSFPTLKEMVLFINDSSCYEPEVDRNISSITGNMGLSDNQVDDLVAFLNTLTDDY